MPTLGGKRPLRMLCPHCGAKGSHKWVSTDPNCYCWNEATAAMFERISGRDICYRVRKKRCISCNRTFSAVEMPKRYLADMIREIQRLERVVDYLQDENGQLSAENRRQTDEIQVCTVRNEELRGEVVRTRAELDHLKEGLHQLADRAVELATRKLAQP